MGHSGFPLNQEIFTTDLEQAESNPIPAHGLATCASLGKEWLGFFCSLNVSWCPVISGPDDQAWGERREAEFNEEDFESAIKGTCVQSVTG